MIFELHHPDLLGYIFSCGPGAVHDWLRGRACSFRGSIDKASWTCSKAGQRCPLCKTAIVVRDGKNWQEWGEVRLARAEEIRCRLKLNWWDEWSVSEWVKRSWYLAWAVVDLRLAGPACRWTVLSRWIVVHRYERLNNTRIILCQKHPVMNSTLWARSTQLCYGHHLSIGTQPKSHSLGVRRYYR